MLAFIQANGHPVAHGISSSRGQRDSQTAPLRIEEENGSTSGKALATKMPIAHRKESCYTVST